MEIKIFFELKKILLNKMWVERYKFIFIFIDIFLFEVSDLEELMTV